jgi:outer membrane protein OmpA-like peptidoglycan-associated protein
MMKIIKQIRIGLVFLVLAISLFLSGCCSQSQCCPCVVHPQCPCLHEPQCPLPCLPCPNVCCPGYHCLPPEIPNHRVTTHYTGDNRCGLINHLAEQGVQVVELGHKVNIILFTDDCFVTNTPYIRESCYPIMDNIVCLLQCYRTVPITVTGYTDNVGDECRNWQLSKNLADSVVAYLWSHGVPLEYIMPARGRGCCDPIASRHTPGGNAYNRRVEIDLDLCGTPWIPCPCYLRGDPCGHPCLPCDYKACPNY